MILCVLFFFDSALCFFNTALMDLVQFWCSPGRFWFSFGEVVVQTWCSSGAVMVEFWCSFGAVLVQYWCSFGAVLVQSWCSSGAVLVQFLTRSLY